MTYLDNKESATRYVIWYLTEAQEQKVARVLDYRYPGCGWLEGYTSTTGTAQGDGCGGGYGKFVGNRAYELFYTYREVV